MPLSVGWQAMPLMRALESLSQSQRVAIVKDRRIDPDQLLTFAIDNKPLGLALEQLAAHLKIGYAQFGPVAFLGPTSVAARLRTLAALRLDEASALSSGAGSKMILARDSRWPALSEPRNMINELAREANVEVVNPLRIPHDLWPEGDLPLLNWLDRVTLIAAQFDLTFRLSEDGSKLEFIEMPDVVKIEKKYDGGKNPRALSRRWERDLPEAKISLVDGEISVDATVEVHEQIERRLRGAPTRKRTIVPGKEQYQLAVESAALDKLVDELAQRLSLTFQWDRTATTEAGIASNQLVTVRVENADLDALLTAVFDKTGLAFRRRGHTIMVRAEK